MTASLSKNYDRKHVWPLCTFQTKFRHSASCLMLLKQWNEIILTITTLHNTMKYIAKNILVFQDDTSCRSRQSLLHSVLGCRGECFLAWGRSEWCWVREMRGTSEPYTAAVQTFVLSSETRLESWCCAAGRRGCMRAVQRQDTNGSGTWSDASTSLQPSTKQQCILHLLHEGVHSCIGQYTTNTMQQGCYVVHNASVSDTAAAASSNHRAHKQLNMASFTRTEVHCVQNKNGIFDFWS